MTNKEDRLQLINAASCTSSGILAGLSQYARVGLGFGEELFLNVSRGYSCFCSVVLLAHPAAALLTGEKQFITLCWTSAVVHSLRTQVQRRGLLDLSTAGFLEWAKITKRLLEN